MNQKGWDPVPFDFESLQVFLAAVEERSIFAAARRNHIVASAASKRISVLEERAGTALLYRHSRGVRPTPAGEALYHHAKRLDEHLRRISDELSEYANGVRGHVRIHVNLTAMVQYLPRDLYSFLQENPQIRLDLVEKTSDQVVQAVVSGLTDIGICSSAPDPALDLDVLTYGVDQLVLVLRPDHRLARRRGVRFEEIMDEDIISLTYGTSIHKLCASAAEQLGRTLRVRMEVTDFEGMRNMIAAGLGIGILPSPSVAPYLGIMPLRMVALKESWSKRPLNIVARRFQVLPLPSQLLIRHLARSRGLVVSGDL
ncbi:MAG: LysR family transcriptional regulator [Castellaniella sp.]|uniref:LysR substrate-binding domain-containing protein n=1 Tax=Castellaniella sp. TaxID=1955812 RepID=UPI001225554D|nr:LysR substrate-binding domain-containing protein [Castellaniella sp.]TAN29756.1 MAG: LysR family transcriptional regulator [Castellaniella sp.]